MEISEAIALLELTPDFDRIELDSNYKRLSDIALDEENEALYQLLKKARRLLLGHAAEKREIPDNPKFIEGKLVLRHLLAGNKNTLVTGAGGTGKSYILTEFAKSLGSKSVAVVSFTGIAAMNVHGETVNSFFGFPAYSGLSFKDWSRMSPRARQKYQALDVLIVDEVSMLSADALDAIDNKLREAKRVDAPFGGVRVILFGDPYQLPPVVKNTDELMYKKILEKYPMGCWFFEAEVYEEADFEIIELTTNQRVDENNPDAGLFIDALRKIRTGDVTDQVLALFNNRVGKEPAGSNYFTIVSTNSEVDRINKLNMDLLKTPLHTFECSARIFGSLASEEIDWSKVTPVKTLELRKGALVIFLKNDDQGSHVVDGESKPRWANGGQGVVEGFTDDGQGVLVKVQTTAGKTFVHTVYRSNWDEIEHTPVTRRLPSGAHKSDLEPKVVATYSQFPLKLAWALTVHKSQGQTYENMKFDPAGTFEAGQCYVALSRATSFAGIGLISPITKKQIKVNEAVQYFMANAKILHFGPKQP